MRLGNGGAGWEDRAMSAFSAALTGKQILVVEDEYLLAQDIAAALRRRGAAVLGPVATIQAAADLIARQRIDAAVLDVNLQGDWSTRLPMR
jgi:CheY-like chemotaxis protein